MHIRERLLRRNVRRVDTIADQVVGRDVETGTQNAAGNNPRSDIDHVIGETTAIGEPGSDRRRSGRDDLRVATGVGGTPVLSRRRSAIGPAGVPVGAIGGAYVTSGSRSVRGGAGMLIPYTALNTLASSGSRSYDGKLAVVHRLLTCSSSPCCRFR